MDKDRSFQVSLLHCDWHFAGTAVGFVLVFGLSLALLYLLHLLSLSIVCSVNGCALLVCLFVHHREDS